MLAYLVTQAECGWAFGLKKAALLLILITQRPKRQLELRHPN